MLSTAMALVQHPGSGKVAAAPAVAGPAIGLRPVLRAVVARMLRLPAAHADVEDCVGETLRRVVEGQERLRPGEPLGPWATGIARHVALDHIRARRREQPGDAALEEPVDSSPSPEETVDRNMRLAALRSALARLDQGPRDALLAFHVEGLSYQEISARLSVPMGTVATWIARSRKAMSEALTRNARKERKS
jgi:RNA polymerase sigma-70 factor (ECF subfamily)